MHRPKKTRTLTIIAKYAIMATSIITMLCLTGCNDASDQMVNETEPIEHFKVEELIGELDVNTSSFKEHVVAVSGFVEDVNYLNKRQTVVLRAKKLLNTTVICDMQKDQAALIESLKPGDAVTIKGILKGALKDVILLNCIIYNETDD